MLFQALLYKSVAYEKHIIEYHSKDYKAFLL